MTKEELLKEIMKLPKVETNNPISTMTSINVDDLMSAVDRLNKIPDYNDLLKENQELKKQLEEYKEQVHKGLYNVCLPYQTGYNKAIKDKETQQKEFMKWLESVKFIGIIPIEMVCDKYKEITGGLDENKTTI